jgi:hypothetical protein
MDADFDSDRKGNAWRRILAHSARLGVVAAVVGAIGGWYADRWVGAVAGAALMAFVFAPCVVLVGYGLSRWRGPTD